MAKLCKLPDIFFDTRSGSYWLKLNENRFLPLDSRNCKIQMMGAGFHIDDEDEFGLKSGDAVLRQAMTERFIDYAGPLSGRKPGMFTTTGGKRILVTSGTTPIQPDKSKGCPRLEKFFEELFGPEQSESVLLWLKISWETLNKGGFKPGQLLVMAGPPNCGKSFFHVLVTHLFGGRCAKPYRYMTGQTAFNSDLAGAEHLMIEDESAKANIGARREFGTAIKDWTVNEEISVHAKGREAITLSFFRRLTLSVNDETEEIMILPPMVKGIADKIMLFKCTPATLSEDRAKNISMLREELPGLVSLLQKMKIPARLRESRFGVQSYHNQELLAQLNSTSPEQRLEDMIDQVIKFDEPLSQWRGTSEDLERELRKSEFNWAVERLLRFDSAMGTYLARLATKNPERYEKKKNTGRTVWIIKKGE